MITCTEITAREELLSIADYLLLSIECTGPDPDRDRIFELGMLRAEGDEIINRASTLIDPEVPLSEEAAERTGVTWEDLAGAMPYAQIAPSVCKLLTESVVAADPTQLAFVRKMLEEQGCGGEIRWIDTARLAAELFPDLPDHSPASLAFVLDVAPEEDLPVLQNALIAHRLFQAWKYPAEETEALTEEESAGEEKPPLVRETPLWLRRIKRSLRLEEMTLMDKILCGVSALLLIAAVILMPALSAFLLLLTALVLLPFPAIRDHLKHWGLTGWRIGVFAGVLLLLAVLFRPVSSNIHKQTVNENGIPSFIILSWDEPGDYGKEITIGADTKYPSKYIEYHLPAGIYRVLNNNAAAATVSVHNNEDYVDEEEDESSGATTNSRGAASITVLANKSKELTVEEYQHVRLSDKAANVVFQYLSPIPEEVEEEEDNHYNVLSEPEKIAYITGDEVRLRKSPSVSAFIMATFDTGKEVHVTGTTGDWTAVTVDNMKGYIYSKYLSETKPEG